MGRLAGRVVTVTGGARGIGRVCSEALAAGQTLSVCGGTVNT